MFQWKFETKEENNTNSKKGPIKILGTEIFLGKDMIFYTHPVLTD